MSDPDLSRLLHDAVADVEPADRLAEIRRDVAGRPRRGGWPTYLRPAAGAALAIAATVTTIALVTSPATPEADDPGPATSGPCPYVSATPGLSAHPAYFIGDTPSGPRLYREFRLAPPMGGTDFTLLQRGPNDPDYRSAWPPGSTASWAVVDDVIQVELGDNPPLERVKGMSAELARLGIQQVVYTLQAEAGRGRLPVEFRVEGGPVDHLLGEPLDGPVEAEPQRDVLALASISNPSEGRKACGSFTADGVASSFEGNVPWELQADDGRVVREGNATAGMDDHLIEWATGSIDVSDLDPGTYTFVATTDDGAFTDTRTVVVE